LPVALPGPGDIALEQSTHRQQAPGVLTLPQGVRFLGEVDPFPPVTLLHRRRRLR
jgi:hypothetical protein